MYKLAFNIFLFISFLGVSHLQASSNISKRAYSKEIKKDFKYNGNELVSLNNQFGKINVETWTKDRVKLSIEIKVKAENEDKAQRIFNRISIQFNNASDLIEVVTVINKEEKSWWNWSNENTDFEINYLVFMPANANLLVNNKYGDVYLAQLEGQVDMHLKYGNYLCDGFSEDGTFELKYSDGIIKKGKQLTVDLKYGSLELLEAEELNINSKYSNVSISDIANVKAETGYDNYDIENIEEFILNGKYNNIILDEAQVVFVTSKYSHFDIGHIENYLSFDVEYSEVNINSIAPAFNEVRLQGRYSDFDLNLDENANYQLDAKSEYAGITYPRAMKVLYEKEKSSVHEVKGGTGGNNSPVIKARLKYGSLKIRK